jgi:predicted porin
MKFVKAPIALSVLAVLSAPVTADVTVYGKANVTIQNSDEGEGSFTEIKSNASRFGLKGSEVISESSGLQVVYKLEWQVDMSDASKGSDNNLKSRNQYVGLKGGFGEVLVGRNDTAMKQSQGKIDLFNDLEGDIKSVFEGENRLGDSVTYKSPSFSNVQFIGSFIADDAPDADNGFSAAVTYGDKGLKKTPIYASVAMDTEVDGQDIVRGSIQGKVAGIKLGAMYQTQEHVDGSNGADGFLLNAAYGLNDYTFKAQYQTLSYDDGSDDKVATSVGVDYKFNKNTKLFGFYTMQEKDATTDNNYLAVGLEYKF